MSEVTKHHIIPQCVLNQFVGSDRKLARLRFKEKGTNSNKRFYSSQVGYGPKFYTLPDAENPLIIEKEINQSYENDFKKFWRLLEVGENYYIPVKAKKRICEIMIHFRIRNTHIRNEVFTGSVITKIEEKLRQSSSEQLGFSQNTSALYKGLDAGPEALQDICKLINEKDEKTLHNWFLSTNNFQSSMDMICELYLDSQWVIHVTDDNHPFIISDNLGLTLNEDDQKWPMTGPFRFFFPISSTRYLEIAHLDLEPCGDPKQNLDFQTASPEYVQQLNLATCCYASREIYGVNGSVLEAVRDDYLTFMSRTSTE